MKQITDYSYILVVAILRRNSLRPFVGFLGNRSYNTKEDIEKAIPKGEDDLFYYRPMLIPEIEWSK